MTSDGIVPGNPYPSTGMATINAPALTDDGRALKLEAKSVKDAGQAHNICRALEQSNRQRSLRSGDIAALHDGQPPYSATDQREKAKAWQANASTLWMAGIVGRVSQRFVNAIISQVYVTASALPDAYPDAKTKSDFLRAKFTSLIRGNDANTGFINSVAVETVLQGYAYAVFLDNYTWQPTFFRQDECWVPEKSGQHARDLQFFAAKRDFRVDKFVELFRDEAAAKDIGYNIENCLQAASKAVMQDPREDAATTQFRKFADMIDEGTIGLSVQGTGERVVKTYMLFNREYDGKVSFWLIERDTGKLLRFSFKEFSRMQDVMAMFSFESGNGCIHSSKGLGRKLAALSIMKELFRCGIIDNSRISGLMVIRVDAKDKTKFAPVIMSPFMMLDKSVEIPEQQFETSAEAYKIVDILIDSWAEQAVGAYLAAQVTDQGRTEKTATEATIDSRRENEAADIMIRRTLDQDANRIQMSQLRVCSDRNLKAARIIYDRMVQDPNFDLENAFPQDIDEANLLRFLVDCFEYGLTDDEIKVWSKSQASAFAHVTEGAVQRGVSAAKQTMSGNPNIDQSQLDYHYLEGLVGADMAKKLFIPKADETTQIEAERKQQMESLSMIQSGLPIKVSPRDNHMGEIPTVIQLLSNVIAPQLSQAGSTDLAMKTAELNLNHLGEHLQFAAQQGSNKLPAFKEYQKFYEGFKKQLSEVVQIKASAQATGEVVAQTIRAENAVPKAPRKVTIQRDPVTREVTGAEIGSGSPTDIQPAVTELAAGQTA